jgi:hypothetical protein
LQPFFLHFLHPLTLFAVVFTLLALITIWTRTNAVYGAVTPTPMELAHTNTNLTHHKLMLLAQLCLKPLWVALLEQLLSSVAAEM